jgi:hypothetical protein
VAGTYAERVRGVVARGGGDELEASNPGLTSLNARLESFRAGGGVCMSPPFWSMLNFRRSTVGVDASRFREGLTSRESPVGLLEVTSEEGATAEEVRADVAGGCDEW